MVLDGRFGCFVDDYQGASCCIEYGLPDRCSEAVKLVEAGLDQSSCEHWQPKPVEICPCCGHPK